VLYTILTHWNKVNSQIYSHFAPGLLNLDSLTPQCTVQDQDL